MPFDDKKYYDLQQGMPISIISEDYYINGRSAKEKAVGVDTFSDYL